MGSPSLKQDELGRQTFQEHPQQAIWCQEGGGRALTQTRNPARRCVFSREGPLPLLKNFPASPTPGSLVPHSGTAITTFQSLLTWPLGLHLPRIFNRRLRGKNQHAGYSHAGTTKGRQKSVGLGAASRCAHQQCFRVPLLHSTLLTCF